MQVVAVPDHRISKEKVKGATQIVNSLMDFKPEHFGLPAFNEEWIGLFFKNSFQNLSHGISTLKILIKIIQVFYGDFQ